MDLLIILCVISAVFGENWRDTVPNNPNIRSRSNHIHEDIEDPICFRRNSYDLDSGLMLRQVDQVLKGTVDENYKEELSVKKLKLSMKKLSSTVKNLGSEGGSMLVDIPDLNHALNDSQKLLNTDRHLVDATISEMHASGDEILAGLKKLMIKARKIPNLTRSQRGIINLVFLRGGMAQLINAVPQATKKLTSLRIKNHGNKLLSRVMQAEGLNHHFLGLKKLCLDFGLKIDVGFEIGDIVNIGGGGYNNGPVYDGPGDYGHGDYRGHSKSRGDCRPTCWWCEKCCYPWAHNGW